MMKRVFRSSRSAVGFGALVVTRFEVGMHASLPEPVNAT
jgi:hypothetical protein